MATSLRVRKCLLPAFLLILFPAGEIAALEKSQISSSDIAHCESVLRYAGREQLVEFDYQTRFAYATSKYCRDITHDYDGKFFYGAVGIDHGYSGKDQQCRDNLNLSNIDQSKFLRIDSVVERAIGAWENCVGMLTYGIKVKANLESQSKVTLAFRRAGETPGEILGVDADNAKCWSHFKEGDKLEYREVKKADVIRLPDNGATTITCRRDVGQGNPIEHGFLLPDASVTVHTIEGPFSYSLPKDVVLTGEWASKLESRLQKELASLRQSLAQTRAEIPRQVVLGAPVRRALGKNGWSGAGQTSECVGGEVVTSVTGGKGFGHTYVECRPIKIQP